MNEKNFNQSQVIRDLSNKGCVITEGMPIGTEHKVNLKNYGEFVILKTIYPDLEIKETKGKEEIIASYLKIKQPAYTINTSKAKDHRSMGNKSWGKVDYLKRNGFQVM